MTTSNDNKPMIPKDIVKELDKYIIGQEQAKKSVAVALRNRWRRLMVKGDMREEIMPNNIIMIGPTGVGKTEIARRLALLADSPFIKVEASKFTEVGYVGRDVESIIRDLTDLAVNMIKAKRSKEVSETAEKKTNERIIDLLLPSGKSKTDETGIVAPGDERRQKTRQKFMDQLINGHLEDKKIEISVPDEKHSMVEVFTPQGMEEMGLNIQEMLGGLLSGRSKKRELSIGDAREILEMEESRKLIDMDNVTKEAIKLVEEAGIVFIDEIDKVVGHSSQETIDVSREGVQRDILPIVEGSTVMTKYGMVRSDHILFIAAGAFHSTKPSDLIPELQGRFPIRVELDSLGEEEFYRILTEPKNALIKQYQALLETDGIKLIFTDDAIHEIAASADKVNTKTENIGARRLQTILSTLLEDILYDSPNGDKVKTVRITKAKVIKELKDIISDEDLSRYIL